MSKNKLIWTFALLLIVLISLPIAHAQAFTESRLFFILINSLIVGAVLFALQAWLIPQKETKEKTAVYVAIAVVSLLIGYFYGQSGFIWQGPLGVFFNFKVLVNAAIITIFLYFLFAYLEINKKLGLESPQGKTGYGILLFFIGALFAIHLGNQWIWEQGTIKLFFNYFFSPQEGILHPNESRLWIFLTTAILLSFFFNNYLIAGQNNKLNIALALILAASLTRGGFGVNTVIIMGEVIFILIFQQALKKGGTGDVWSWILSFGLVGWASAAISASTPQYGGVLGSIFGGIYNTTGWKGFATIGAVLTLGGLLTGVGGIIIFAIIAAIVFFAVWSKTNSISKALIWAGIIFGIGLLLSVTGAASFVLLILAIILVILFGGGIYAISRGEGRSRIWRDGLTRAMTRLRNIVSRNETANRILGKWFSLRDTTLEREIPFKLKELRLVVYTLMNYMLRYDIYYTKFNSFKLLIAEIKEENVREADKRIEGILQEQVPIRENIAASIKRLVEGSRIEKNEDMQIWELKGEEVDEETGRIISTKPRAGWGRQYWFIYELIHTLKQQIEAGLTGRVEGGAERQGESIGNTFNELIQSNKPLFDDYYARYKKGLRRFGAANYLRSHRLYFIDMYNQQGEYKRGYFFAKPDSIPDYYDYDVIAQDDTIYRGIKRKVKTTSRVNIPDLSITPEERKMFRRLSNKKYKTPDEVALIRKVEAIKKRYEDGKLNYEQGTDYLLELDLFGYCLSDINAVEVDGTTKQRVQYIKKYHREDMWEIYQPAEVRPKARFSTIFEWSARDWEFYVDDLGRGWFHPYSKRLSDYEFITKEGFLDYSKATFKGPAVRGATAFDWEGLKSMNKFVYWGRNRYYDPQGLNLSSTTGIVNPYPTISLQGLWGFIGYVASRKIKDTALANRYLKELEMEFERLEKIQIEGGEGGKQ